VGEPFINSGFFGFHHLRRGGIFTFGTLCHRFEDREGFDVENLGDLNAPCVYEMADGFNVR
jgi:hypothetical protein